VDSNENDLMRFYVNHDKNTTTTKRKNDRHWGTRSDQC
jgi:hypothetical protein